MVEEFPKGPYLLQNVSGHIPRSLLEKWEIFWRALDAEGIPFPEGWALGRFRKGAGKLLRSEGGVAIEVTVKEHPLGPHGYYWGYTNRSGITCDIALWSLSNTLAFVEGHFRAAP